MLSMYFKALSKDCSILIFLVSEPSLLNCSSKLSIRFLHSSLISRYSSSSIISDSSLLRATDNLAFSLSISCAICFFSSNGFFTNFWSCPTIVFLLSGQYHLMQTDAYPFQKYRWLLRLSDGSQRMKRNDSSNNGLFFLWKHYL